jgi:hypothetical protein
MKLLGIALLMMCLVMVLSIGMDMLMGFDVQKAKFNATYSSRTYKDVEIFILFFLIFLLVSQSVKSFIRK